MTNNPQLPLTSHPFNQISWTAIFVATIIGFGLGFLVELFGLAITLSLVNTGNTGALTIAIVGMIGILAGLALSMFIAGYAAGYLGRLHRPERNAGLFYGLTTWCLVLILNALMAAPLNQYVSSFTATLYPSDTAASNNQGLTLEALSTNTQNAEDIANDAPVPLASPKTLAESAFIILGLFLTGAWFSCFGAYRAMRCQQISS